MQYFFQVLLWCLVAGFLSCLLGGGVVGLGRIVFWKLLKTNFFDDADEFYILSILILNFVPLCFFRFSHFMFFSCPYIFLISQLCRIDIPKLFKSFISQLSRLELSIGFILKFISQVHVYFLYLVLFRHEVSISCLTFLKIKYS